jgi:hypothetical protein
MRAQQSTHFSGITPPSSPETLGTATPTASFIPARGNAPGSGAASDGCRPTACLITADAAVMKQVVGLHSLTWNAFPRALPLAGMHQACGLKFGQHKAPSTLAGKMWVIAKVPWRFTLLLLATTICIKTASGASPEALFQAGAAAYRAADYPRAVEAFRESVALQPASGSLLNFGNAEWQLRHPGAAILAWEQALWVDPFNRAARENLQFARKLAQLETPDLTWYEVVSSWLPATWWAWIAGVSLWTAVGMVMLPGILRRPKATWHQAVAALALMVFLLSLPAHLGIAMRSRLGFVLQKDTPLRLTPTAEAQAITRLSAGEPARCVRTRGEYVLLRTSRALGWVTQDQFGLTCPRSPRAAR